MKVSVLSSGSKGNTTYIESNNAKILIDLGNTSKYVKEKLEDLGVFPGDIDAILITHTHVDHIGGLKIFAKKYNIPVYITEVMHKTLDYIDNYKLLEDEFDIKDIHVTTIKTSHDALIQEDILLVVKINQLFILLILDILIKNILIYLVIEIYILWNLIMMLKCLLMENILLILDREYYLIKDIYPIMILLSICLLL